MRPAVHNPNPYPSGLLPIVTFDTSALNRSLDDSLHNRHLVAAIVSKRHVRFAGLSIHELLATRKTDRRKALLAHCRLLYAGQSDSVHSYREVLRLLVSGHAKNPSHFDWTRAHVMGEKYADEIRNCKFALDDDLAERSRVEQRAQLRQFKLLLSKRHPESEAIFAAHGEAKLTTFSGAISWLGENSDVSLPVLTGKLHYKQFAGNDPNDEAVVDLFNHCPPFRAFCIASLMPQYDSLLRDRNKGQKCGAGWNDLAMSIYLPYCDHFVTNDLEQQACLREVAIRASLATAVISYDEFSRSLLG